MIILVFLINKLHKRTNIKILNIIYYSTNKTWYKNILKAAIKMDKYKYHRFNKNSIWLT